MSEERTGFDIKDLKKLYASNSSPETTVKLCYSQKEVGIRPMKVKDKKEILKAIESKKENIINKALDNIIEKYVEPVDESDFDIGDLTSPERHQILVHIRVAAAGDTAKIVHECPACAHVNTEIEYNLNDMYVQNYEEPETGNILKVAGGAITLHLGPMTRQNEIQVENYLKRKKIQTAAEKNFALMAGVIRKVEMSQDDITAEVKLDIEEKIDFFPK